MTKKSIQKAVPPIKKSDVPTARPLVSAPKPSSSSSPTSTPITKQIKKSDSK